ncbi:histidine phosphatase family protein [Pontibacter sp. HSC-14F20]|uniref:SixA phosphatase family protein n=1 Tax=Pontibacter sp. HSC-14F20 TaxID=2864136 RepID=UPI001C72CC2C|nr:histidine phosphatase family protein [Pontibacter sp. HSC-14F20]MBX0333920.1 histidine phosphatase family protein [Pontibacter sp. HSC-14F20]
MKTLYIMRHAKSSWNFEELSDHDRPLNKRGRTDAPLMGQELVANNVKLQLILSSPAVRALTTATLVARELDYDADDIAIDDRMYGASAEELLEITREAPSEVDFMLMVGHNEALSEFANMLSPEHVSSIPTAGIVALRFDCDNWADISPSNAKLLFYDVPKNHK